MNTPEHPPDEPDHGGTEDRFEEENRSGLIAAISSALTGGPGFYRELVDAEDLALVELIRSCGRAAGRRQNITVRTLDVVLSDGRHEVIVLNTTPLDPTDELAQARHRRKLREIVNNAL